MKSGVSVGRLLTAVPISTRSTTKLKHNGTGLKQTGVDLARTIRLIIETMRSRYACDRCCLCNVGAQAGGRKQVSKHGGEANEVYSTSSTTKHRGLDYYAEQSPRRDGQAEMHAL